MLDFWRENAYLAPAYGKNTAITESQRLMLLARVRQGQIIAFAAADCGIKVSDLLSDKDLLKDCKSIVIE